MLVQHHNMVGIAEIENLKVESSKQEKGNYEVDVSYRVLFTMDIDQSVNTQLVLEGMDTNAEEEKTATRRKEIMFGMMMPYGVFKQCERVLVEEHITLQKTKKGWTIIGTAIAPDGVQAEQPYPNCREILTSSPALKGEDYSP